MAYEFDVAQGVMTIHYLLLTFMLSLAALQIGATVGGVRGIWLIESARWNLAAAIAIAVTGVSVFTLLPLWTDGPWAAGSVVEGTSEGRTWGAAALEDLTRARNLNDIHGGLNGGDYGSWFPVSAIVAVGFSVVFAALRRRMTRGLARPALSPDHDGFEALSRTDWFAAVRNSLRHLRGTIWHDLRAMLDAAPDWALPKIIANRVQLDDRRGQPTGSRSDDRRGQGVAG